MLEISKIKPISTLIPTIIVAKQSIKSSHLYLIYDGAIPFFFSNCKELFSINYVWIWDEFQIFALSSKNDKIDLLSMNPNLFQFLQKIDLQQNILNYQTNKKIKIKKYHIRYFNDKTRDLEHHLRYFVPQHRNIHHLNAICVLSVWVGKNTTCDSTLLPPSVDGVCDSNCASRVFTFFKALDFLIK